MTGPPIRDCVLREHVPDHRIVGRQAAPVSNANPDIMKGCRQLVRIGAGRGPGHVPFHDPVFLFRYAAARLPGQLEDDAHALTFPEPTQYSVGGPVAESSGKTIGKSAHLLVAAKGPAR